MNRQSTDSLRQALAIYEARHEALQGRQRELNLLMMADIRAELARRREPS